MRVRGSHEEASHDTKTISLLVFSVQYDLRTLTCLCLLDSCVCERCDHALWEQKKDIADRVSIAV